MQKEGFVVNVNPRRINAILQHANMNLNIVFAILILFCNL